MVLYLTEGNLLFRSSAGPIVTVLAIASSDAEADDACEQNTTLGVVGEIYHSAGSFVLLADMKDRGFRGNALTPITHNDKELP